MVSPTLSPPAMASLSDSSSARVFVPKMFLASVDFEFQRSFQALPESGRGEQLGRLGIVGDVADRSHGVPGRDCIKNAWIQNNLRPNVVVHHSINSNGNAVFGQNLLRWNIERDCPENNSCSIYVCPIVQRRQMKKGIFTVGPPQRTDQCRE